MFAVFIPGIAMFLYSVIDGPDDAYPARWLCIISLTERYRKGLYVSIGSGSL